MDASNLRGHVQIAANNRATFSNANINDFLIYTSSNTQKILMGTMQNSNASLTITSNMVDIVGDLNFSGALRQGGAPFQNSRWSSNATGVHIMSNIGVGTSNLAGPGLTLNGNLYMNNASLMLSQGSNNAYFKSEQPGDLILRGSGSNGQRILLGTASNAIPVLTLENATASVSGTFNSPEIRSVALMVNSITVEMTDPRLGENTESVKSLAYTASNLATVAQLQALASRLTSIEARLGWVVDQSVLPGATVTLDGSKTVSSGNTWSTTLSGGPTATMFALPTFSTPFWTMNGAFQYATIPHISDVTGFTNTNAYTVAIMAWINSSQTTNDKSIVEKWNSTKYPYVFRYTNTNIHMSCYDGTNIRGVNASSVGLTNKWSFIVGTFDHPNKQMVLYINGTAQASLSNYTLYDCADPTPVHLFAAPRGGSPQYNLAGRLGYFAIWNRALSASEVSGLNSVLQTSFQ